MKRVYARTFECDLDLDTAYDQLNKLGPWQWSWRDNDQWGEYVSSVLPGDTGWAKLYPTDGGAWLLNFKYASDKPDPQAKAELQQFEDTLYQAVLPSIGARNLQPSENVR